MFRKNETMRFSGGQKGLVVVTVCQFQNWVLFILKQWKFLNFDSFVPLKSCEEGCMVVRQAIKKHQ